MGEYDPKKKGLPVTWRGLQRRLPSTLSTFQLVVVAAFMSLLILRSSIGLGSSGAGRRGSSPSDGPFEADEADPKRNLVQRAEQELERIRQAVASKTKETVFPTGKQSEATDKVGKAKKGSEPEDDPHGKDVSTADVVERAGAGAHAGKMDDDLFPKDKELRKKVPVPKDDLEVPPERVEDEAAELAQVKSAKRKMGNLQKDLQKEPLEVPEQVEAALAEEETPEELAEFRAFEKESAQSQKRIDDEVSSRKKPKAAAMDDGDRKEMSAQSQKRIDDGVSSRKEPKAAAMDDGDWKEMSAKEKEESSAAENVEQDESPDQDGLLEPEEVVDESVEVGEEVKPKRPLMSTEAAIEKMNDALRRDDPEAFTLGVKVNDWDGQRAEWMAKHPEVRSANSHHPNVLMLSGSQPWVCKSAIGDHYILKMIKNKVDYGRIHKMEVFYNLAHLDPAMTTFWAKLPIIRKMMLTRPDMDWVLWMDSDAMFTDMVFEIPFEKYESYNLVMWGFDEGLYKRRSWVACNTGVLLLRNNDWTLGLLESWSHMGPHGPIRNAVGSILAEYLPDRPEMPADDQSALVFLLLTRPELRSKVKLEWDYWLSGYWAEIVDKYEQFEAISRPGAGGQKWPFTTHFTGCQPCSGENNKGYKAQKCFSAMERAFNFADNQVLKSFGFTHSSLETFRVTRIRNETTTPLRTVPLVNPWAVESFY